MDHPWTKYEPVFLVVPRQEDPTPLSTTEDSVSEAKQPRLDTGDNIHDNDPQMKAPQEAKFDDVNYRLTNADEKTLAVHRFVQERTIDILDTANRNVAKDSIGAKMTFSAAEAMALLMGCEYKSVILKIVWGAKGKEIVVEDRIEPMPPDTQQDNEVHFQRLVQRLKTLTKDSKECRYALHNLICASEAEGLGTVLMPVVVLFSIQPVAHPMETLAYQVTAEESLRLNRDIAFRITVDDLQHLDFAKVIEAAAEAAQAVVLQPAEH